LDPGTATVARTGPPAWGAVQGAGVSTVEESVTRP
jgi:hypothetical protein